MTPEELSTALQKLEQRVEWELNEWYEKFSALHARLEKRVQREAKKNGVGREQHVEQLEPVSNGKISVLAHRKPWSP